MIELRVADPGDPWIRQQCIASHYLRKPVDVRCRVFSYEVYLPSIAATVGFLVFGRPQATKVRGWYAGTTYWTVLNLARVWFEPTVQRGGDLYQSCLLPGYTDRRGVWRSTLASTAVRLAMQSIGYDYLLAYPPCFLDEPYQIDWLLSYCDTRLHRGTIYQAAGFELYRTNDAGIQTWRVRLSPLTPTQDAHIQRRAVQSPRSKAHRALRAVRDASQLPLIP